MRFKLYLSLLFLLPVSVFAVTPSLVETATLADDVAAAKLPAVEDRAPTDPLVVDFEATGRQHGRHGGQLNILMGQSKDTRLMSVYSYARLVGYDEALQLRPDILTAIDNQANRVFTLKLRAGHRWSDGHPFTAEDFRYFWEDVALNEDLSPFGPPHELLVNGEKPVVEVLSDTEVRYTWSQPNPYFLSALAGARPLYIYAPAHYLKQFHASYADAKKLAVMVDDAGVRNWAGLHTRKGHMYKFDNPDLPTLEAWINTTWQPSERFVFVRNPYYHRVDSRGHQLPYIDEVIMYIASSSLIPAKTGAGESHLQARYLRLDNFTFLKESEARNDFGVRLWQKGTGSQIALYPNMNSADPAWRALTRDVRFRRALSMAVDRAELNQVVYFGLALESANTVLPACPLFRPEYQTAWTQFDIKEANRLLDEIGLTKRDKRGVRLMPDGKPLEIVVHTAGESTEQTDVLELVQDTWSKIGVKLFTKPSQREVFRDRVFSGEAMMSVWSGVDNGLPTLQTAPDEFVPTAQDQLQWPKWGQYLETGGSVGEAPDIESAKRLLELREAWRLAESDQEREEAWSEILRIHQQEVFSIGLVCGVPQPVVVSNRLKNVPEEGIYSWAPGAFFGMYKPDTFWFDGK